MALAHEKFLIEKIRELPPERVAEVEDFVDFLKQREQARNTKPQIANNSLDFPVDNIGDWPENYSLNRGDLYSDDGR